MVRSLAQAAEKAQHDKMVSLVERTLALHKSLQSAHNPQEADCLSREVESVDKSIDGLGEEEIGIVESWTLKDFPANSRPFMPDRFGRHRSN